MHARVLAHDPTLGNPPAPGRTLPLEVRPLRALVGRDEELQRLRDAWQRAVRGRPCTVVVRGPVGAGGSALAAAFAAEVAREGARLGMPGRSPPHRHALLLAHPRPLPRGLALLVADHAPSAG